MDSREKRIREMAALFMVGKIAAGGFPKDEDVPRVVRRAFQLAGYMEAGAVSVMPELLKLVESTEEVMRD